MSISALGNSFSSQQAGNLSFQLGNSQFRQLGQDLTTGNLSGAQSDFATLQQAFAAPTSSPPSSGSSSSGPSSTANPVAQAFQQLSSDLTSGNLPAAKQDYSTIQQQFANRTGTSRFGHHPVSGTEQNTLLQQLNQLGQELSATNFFSGNVNAAQQAYGAPEQMLGNSGSTNLLAQGQDSGGFSDLPVSLLA